MSSELGAIVTKPNNVYAQLNNYNENSVWGPAISPIVPPMQYITLPHEYDNYGYNALSHDYDGIGYYNVETGYGKRCTSFHLAQCPRNEPIKPPAFMVSTRPPALRESFSLEKKKQVDDTLRALNLVVFVDTKNCPHSQTLINLLKNNGVINLVTIKEISSTQNRNDLLSSGGTGVPFTKSKTTGASVTGAPPSLDVFIKALAKQQPSVAPVRQVVPIEPVVSSTKTNFSPQVAKQLKDLDLAVYVSYSCHYCTLYKQFIERNGLRPYIQIKDLSNKEEVASDPYLQTNSLPAIPFTYSRKYKTSFPGVPKSINEILALITTQSP